MKAWKRNALIVFLACTLVTCILFLVYGFGAAAPFVKFLFVLLALVVFAGVGAGAYIVLLAFMHEHATLHAGPEGVINIERSALESTARRALGSIEGLSLQKVEARVIERKDEPVIDLTVTAVSYGQESLMVVAGRIQTTAKRAVEAFTDHEVRYVAVNFIEPKKRHEVSAAANAEEARASAGYVPPRYPGFKGSSASEAPAGKGAGQAAAKPSLWARAKDKAGEMRAKMTQPNEDVVETTAVVEDVEFVAPAQSNVAATEPVEAVSAPFEPCEEVAAEVLADDACACEPSQAPEREVVEAAVEPATAVEEPAVEEPEFEPVDGVVLTKDETKA